MPNTNIVVSCWNALEYSKVTINRLFDTVKADYYLTIVDNASSDGTSEFLNNLEIPDNCKKLVRITNKENLGNVGAVNQGYEASKELGARFTCLCNNDLYFQSGWFERLENCMLKDQSIGMVGPLRPCIDVQHYNGQPTSVMQRMTPPGSDWSEELLFFMGRPFTEFDVSAEKIVHANEGGLRVLNVPPDALSSCCVFVKNEAADRLGWMADPQFSPYGSDDIDLTWSIAKLGYKCVMLQDIYVHHFRSKSIQANGVNQDKLLYDNNQKFYAKWGDTIQAFLLTEEAKGVDIKECLSEERNNGYWFLFRLNCKVGFLRSGDKVFGSGRR